MRIGPIAGLTLCVISLGCVGTPTRPSQAFNVPTTSDSVESTAGSAQQARINGDGTSGDPGCTTPRPCLLIGDIRFTSVDSEGTFGYSPLWMPYRGAQTLQPLVDIYDFANFALLDANSATGRFAEGTPPTTIALQVTAQVATVTVTFSRSGRTFEASASTKPAFASTADLSCLSGVRLQTKLVVGLGHFGKSEIIDSHCTLAD